jgi:tripartite-type tricarboxylate transporter receptor subunit TctC
VQPGFPLETAQAIVAPQATPTSVIGLLDNAIQRAVHEPSFIALAERTQSAIDYKGPEAFAAELRRAFEVNGKLLGTLGIKSQ